MSLRQQKFRIAIEGLNQLRKKLSTDYLLGGNTWRGAMSEATLLAKSSAAKNAPKASGQLGGTLTHRLDARPVPKYGIVMANAQNRGFRYGFALEAGFRTPKKARGIGRKRWRAAVKETGGRIALHFRGTGKSTRGWFRGSLLDVQRRINGILDKAARKIEQRWERG